MTVSNQNSSVTLNGNGVTTLWPYSFIIPDEDSARVGLFDIASGVLTEISDTDYSISGINDPNGGEVTYPLIGSPISAAKRLVIWREVEYTQDTDLTNQTPYYPVVLEAQLDRIVMQVQQLAEESGRALKVTQGSDLDPDEFIEDLQSAAGDAEAAAASAAADAASAAASAAAAEAAIGQPADGTVTRAKLSSAMSKTIGISVFEHGATGDNVTDDGPAFEAAQAAAIAAGIKLVVVPQGNYRINTQIDIAADVVWLFLGARLTTTLDTMTILSADTVDGWSILGDVRLIGSLTTPDVEAQYGLYVKDCNRCAIEGVTCQNIKGAGFWVTGVASPGERGDRPQFNRVAAYDCTVGRQLDAGAGAEFTTWTNWQASDCAKADVMGAGNTITSGYSIVDCIIGIQLIGGSNHGHGIYANGNISHCTVPIDADDVTNGYTISPVHIYDGEIQITNCDGLVIEGVLDIDSVVVTSGASSGFNYIRNTWWDDSYGPVAFSGTGIAKLVVQNCNGPGVPTRNTFHDVELHAYRNKGSTQGLVSATLATVIFPSETNDPQEIYDAATGIVTIPAGKGGIYEFTWTIVVGGTSLTNVSYGELQQDPLGGAAFVEQIPFGPVLYSSTLIVFQGAAALRMAAGAKARLQVSVTGTSPVVGHASYYCLLTVKKLGN